MRSIRTTTTAQRRGSDSLTTLWHPPAAFLLLQGFWVGSGLPHTLSFLTGDFIRRPFLPIGCLFEVPTSAPHSGFILNSFPQSTALCFNPPSVFFPFPSLCSPSPFFNPSWIPASRTHTWIKKQSNQLKKERKKERNTALITKSSLSTHFLYFFNSTPRCASWQVGHGEMTASRELRGKLWDVCCHTQRWKVLYAVREREKWFGETAVKRDWDGEWWWADIARKQKRKLLRWCRDTD